MTNTSGMRYEEKNHLFPFLDVKIYYIMISPFEYMNLWICYILYFKTQRNYGTPYLQLLTTKMITTGVWLV